MPGHPTERSEPGISFPGEMLTLLHGLLGRQIPGRLGARLRQIFFDKQYALTGHWRQWEPPASKPLAMEPCKHPRVRVLTREEDAEFVECLECGEVFDSHEFTDMAIEERTQMENQEEAGSKPES